MPDICFALLAHKGPEHIAQVVENIRHFAPDHRIVVYNSGDPAMPIPADVAVCPYSRPLGYHFTASFHYDIARWLVEERAKCDYLVNIETDMALVRPGLDAFLDKTMKDAGYMGPHFGPVPDPPRAKFLAAIAGRWDVLGNEVGVDRPYKTFYPGQVFRRDYMEALVAVPEIEKLIGLGDKYGMLTWHEVVYPTMAVRLAVDPRAWPEGDALRPTRRDRATWARLLQSPDVYLVHKVAADSRSPDRRVVLALEQGRNPDLERLPTGYSRRLPIWSPSSQWFSERFTAGERAARVRRRLRSRA